MNFLPWLIVLYLLSKRQGGGGGSWTAPTPHGGPPQGPHTYPPVPTGVPVNMPSGPTFSSQWTPYKPLTQHVIARAQQLLHDPTAKQETIEADPAGGTVRYLKLNAPHGHISVTAWKPKAAQPAAAASAPHPVTT